MKKKQCQSSDCNLGPMSSVLVKRTINSSGINNTYGTLPTVPIVLEY